MIEGLLWFDNDPKRKLADKIGQAAARFTAKFGYRPTVCYLNPADFDEAAANGIELRTADNVLRHHLWIGVESQPEIIKSINQQPTYTQGVLL